jgi:hypothetical protein
MKQGVQQKTKQKIETIEGLTCREALFNIYFIQFQSFRKICKKWNINNRTIMRLFNEYGFVARLGSEAVKTQWIDAEQRRINTSNKLKETRIKNPNPALGCKRPDASIRMKINNPMFDLHIRKKANDKTIQTYKENPTRHKMFHEKLTECESIVFNFLVSKGFECIGNELVNGRFVDVFIPSLNIAIECVNHSRFPLSYDRHCQVSNNNVKVIYCTNNFIKKSDLNILYNYIINSDIFSTFPTINSKETMIFGRRNGIIFDSNIDNFIIDIINVNKTNILRLTTSTNNNIINI